MDLYPKSELFTRGVDKIITSQELAQLLKSKKQIRIKFGIDATGELHIGHAVNLWKIRALQEAGHKAVIIYGDFTTTVGDPTGRIISRPKLEKRSIEINLKKIKKQVEQILLTDSSVYEPRRNSEWFANMRVPDFMGILALVTHARLVERDMFQRRIEKGADISMEEFVYPILQGYDSVAVKSDLTIIGSDQLFNEHLGRRLQEKFNMKPQVIVAHKILPGLAGGEKMSKSLGNYIGLNDSPTDKFGKAMRVLDELIIPYLEVYTDVPLKKIEKLAVELKNGKNPMEVKLFLAEALVRRYHGFEIAQKEKDKFLHVFSQKREPDETALVKTTYGERDVVELLVELGMADSKSEARRLILQRAVKVGDRIVVPREKVKITKGILIKVGKRKYVRIL